MDIMKRLKRMIIAMIFMFIAMLAVGVGCIWYTSHEIRINNAKWCDLMHTIDNPIPPRASDPRSVSAAAQIHQLRNDLGC
jgi:hypothetical protein